MSCECSSAFLLGFPEPVVESDRQILFAVYLLMLSTFMYGFSYWLVEATAVIKLTDEFGGNAEDFGWLQAVFGVTQIIASLVFGHLVDRIGPKIILIVAFTFGNASFNLAFVLAQNMIGLYVARIPGLFMSAMLVTSAMIAKIHAQACLNYKAANKIRALRRGEDPEDEQLTVIDAMRSVVVALSRVYIMYNLGRVVGAFLGGYVTEKAGVRTPFWIGFGLSIAMAIILLAFLPTVSELQEGSQTEIVALGRKSAEQMSAETQGALAVPPLAGGGLGAVERSRSPVVQRTQSIEGVVRQHSGHASVVATTGLGGATTTRSTPRRDHEETDLLERSAEEQAGVQTEQEQPQSFYELFLTNPVLRGIFLVELAFSFGKLMFFTSQQNITDKVLGFKSSEQGVFIAANAAAVIVANAILLYPFTLCFSNDKWIFLLNASLALGLFVFYGEVQTIAEQANITTQASKLAFYITISSILGMFLSVGETVLVTMMSLSVSTVNKGNAIAMTHVVYGVAEILAPILAGVLVERTTNKMLSVGLAGAGFMALAFLMGTVLVPKIERDKAEVNLSVQLDDGVNYNDESGDVASKGENKSLKDKAPVSTDLS